MLSSPIDVIKLDNNKTMGCFVAKLKLSCAGEKVDIDFAVELFKKEISKLPLMSSIQNLSAIDRFNMYIAYTEGLNSNIGKDIQYVSPDTKYSQVVNTKDIFHNMYFEYSKMAKSNQIFEEITKYMIYLAMARMDGAVIDSYIDILREKDNKNYTWSYL